MAYASGMHHGGAVAPMSIKYFLQSIFLLAILCAGQTMAAPSQNIDSGRLAYKQGHFKQAIENWQQVEQDLRKANDQPALIELLWLEAEAFRALGQHNDAILRLADAIRLTKTNKVTPMLQASMLSSYGDSLGSIGSPGIAVQYLKQAVQIARKDKNDAILAVSLNNLGNNYFKISAFISAADAYAECTAIAERTGNKLLLAESKINITRILVLQDQLDSAHDALRVAANSLSSVPDSHAKLNSLSAIGKISIDLYTKSGEKKQELLKQAYDNLSKADELAGKLNDTRAKSFSSGYLGKIYVSKGRLDEAMLLTNKAIYYAQQSNAPESEYIWHWQAGRIHKSQNSLDAAIASYRLAVEKLQLIRNKLPTTTAFKDILGPVFFELTDLLLQKPGTLTDKSKVEDYLKEARQTMELLKTAELQDYFQDNCVTALQSRVSSLDDINARTAVLYPIILKDRMEILLSTSKGMEHAVVNINEDELRTTINKFRVLLVDLNSDGYLQYSKELYDLIIRPIQPTLEANNIETLVIVPDSALRTIPLAALHDGKDFLIARYAIAVTPGLTLTDAKPLVREKLDVLVGGLTESVQGFSALPNVALEVDNIKNTYTSTILMNKDYNVSGVETELTRTNFNIVHIASHAQFSSKPEETYLLAHEGKFTMDKLESLINKTKFRDQPVELITLSACQTAAGDERAALGLAGIAIKAGARSALATLWFINDKASSLLVSDFYKNLKNPDLSKAKALQQAQLNIMHQDKYQHPLFWSPFLLIGNWL